jgi:UDP-N-acetylmuramyl pentapeptide phosphotransferase/UDP-N-acetylglucosamine-1-phosphate transferase
MEIYHIIFPIIISFLFLFICKRNNILLDRKIEKHKKFTSIQENYSIGGVLIFFNILYYHFFYSNFEMLTLLFLSIIFLLGLFSDLRVLNNPKMRFLLQGLILFVFVSLIELKITNTRIPFFDVLLNNSYFNLIFTVFCLMILINGSNFIDGLNTLLINYNIILYLILILFFNQNFYDIGFLKYLVLTLLVLLFFNFNGKIILGDSGSYLISLFSGFLLIRFSNDNLAISPYFIVLLLWYPCYELLFSMIRRLKSKKTMYEPDVHHFHQVLFSFIEKKLEYSRNFNHLIVSTIINFYNLILIIIGINFAYQTKELIFILFVNIVVYSTVYFALKRT